ncbi:MAG: molybdopterin molybdotransferase MoeA [Pseudomonadota bacterium]
MRPISLDQAWGIIAAAVMPLKSEMVGFSDAAGRVLSAPVVATFDSPQSNVSMMDGYAVHDAMADDTLDVVGVSAAGSRFDGKIVAGQAVRIFTGAAVPEGAERIMIQEHVTTDGDRITILEPTIGPTFVRAIGSDFRAAECVVAAGTLLTPGALVAAAGAGIAQVSVTRRPRVATIATGDELRAVGAAPEHDSIPDSIGPGLAAMLGAMGADVVGHGLLGDDLGALERAAAEAVAVADLVVVTGGASVGERDHAKAMFAPLGLELLFSKVAIKPGKPVWLGRVGETLIMGLPGNPGSALVTARLLLAPLVAGLLGQQRPSPLDWIDLPLGAAISATGERETFLRATFADGKLIPVANQDSGAQRALGEATWLIRCPAGQSARVENELVSALAF